MKKFFVFLWRATIPMFWLLSVLAAFRGGFQLGYIPPPPPGQTYPYPWAGVIFTIFVTAIECAFLYYVLRPDRLDWSLPRVGVAFFVFLILSFYAIYTTVTDQPGYAYVPGNFTLALTFFLLILLIITMVIMLVNRFSARAQAK